MEMTPARTNPVLEKFRLEKRILHLDKIRHLWSLILKENEKLDPSIRFALTENDGVSTLAKDNRPQQKGLYYRPHEQGDRICYGSSGNCLEHISFDGIGYYLEYEASGRNCAFHFRHKIAEQDIAKILCNIAVDAPGGIAQDLESDEDIYASNPKIRRKNTLANMKGFVKNPGRGSRRSYSIGFATK